MKFLPKPWQLFVIPRWERGRPVRNRGRRPLERLRPLWGGRDARAPSELLAPFGSGLSTLKG